MFTSLLNNATGSLTVSTAIYCTLASIVLGFLIAIVYKVDQKSTKNFTITLVLLPVMVQMVIMMVNGNLGTSVAVLGTFGLVRFRSLPGTSKEICFIFLAMAIGLATGMGYLTFAVFTTTVCGVVYMMIHLTHFADTNPQMRDLRITIPENLDYTTIFDDVFEQYTRKVELNRIKTTNLGSMIECRYTIILKDAKEEKQMIDEIRCRNGNLTVLCGRVIESEVL